MSQKKHYGGKNRPTMMDVASMAGVSQATVSLVLNGSPAKLTEATRQRVIDSASKLGYQLVRRDSQVPPSNKARSTIIFIADEISTDPWMALAFEGAHNKALEYGINVCLAVSHGNALIEASIVNQMADSNVIGFIYGTILTRLVELPVEFSKNPTVLVNCYDSTRTLPSVLPGDLLGGRAAAERLIHAGRKRIAIINGQKGVDASRDRLKGYRQALTSNDIPFDPTLVRSGNWEPSTGYSMTHELMALDNPPDAIFCANDLMALGCYDALRELGKSIPDDVAVIGFDDREIAQHTHPALTTLVLPQYEMGEIGAEMLIDSIGGLLATPNQIKVECQMVERDSVEAPPKNA
ncbi:MULTISPECIES: LacI family DNA-binding transcriptional regulator [Thalassospira]|uniref:LacI family transcriptional regulator n=2 Tax=Thalassospira TaxID=168934 RepID=A0A367W2G3_9PROT|nr:MULTISPECIES: LacI family DNA-binding transcriptional regulator [Thalassospira]MDG4717857.1 LacI family DNA-binding transcriptional regulator [Thalassospira sp. FZY0004]RCK32371.1 LacI family transcriptional regulator [Thalassospira profundimaris]